MSSWQRVRVPYLSERRVRDAVQLGGALVSQVVKDIEGTHRFGATLLVAENKVNPLMQLTRYKLTFQGLSEERGTCRSEQHVDRKAINTTYFTVHR